MPVARAARPETRIGPLGGRDGGKAMNIFITGAGRGIGAALFDHYLALGHTVTGTLRGTGGGHGPRGGRLLSMDVTDPAAIARAAAAVAGPVDLLVCNAGVYLDRSGNLGSDYDAAIWAESFAVNATGVWLTVRGFLPHLRRSAAGRIAILSSVMASDAGAPGGSYAYRASKAAALNIGRNLAVDLAPERIAVGIYHPGWVRTDMGGPGADIAVAQSAEGLARRFAALSPATTGTFEDYAGNPIPF